MRSINWTGRAIIGGLMLSMTLGFGLAAPRAAAAAVIARGQDRDSQRWDRRRLGRYAFALGYNRGYEDAAVRSYRSYRDVQRWREGAEGWENPMGNRAVFHDNFRRGFAQGFADGRRHRARRYNPGDMDRIRSETNHR